LQIKSPIASDFKLGRESFTREGPLSPELLISLLVYMAADGGRRGYQHLLDGFWHEAKLNRVTLPVDDPVSAPAFCNARKKLSSAAVQQLLRDTADEFDVQHGRRHRIRGRRILAVDGSQMPLQRAPELWKEFGGPSNGYTPQAKLSVLFDVVAKLPLDAVITPYLTDERAQLSQLLSSTREGDILVLDRGFPSFGVIDMLIERGLDFVLRMPLTQGFHVVEEFVRSGRDEADIVLMPPAHSPASLSKARRLRAVRRIGPQGRPQVFLTTLPRRQFSHAHICDLYRRRWEIELLYRLEKCDYVGQRQFHAKFSEGVRQEVFAFLLFIAISRTLMSAASKTCDAPYERLSQKRAILATARVLTLLLLEAEADQAPRMLAELLRHIGARLDPKPRHRSCRRRSFKPRSRWGPHGHRRAVWKKERLR
jgi:hypothetical protein